MGLKPRPSRAAFLDSVAVASLRASGFKAGSFKLWGTRDLHFYELKQIKRVRVVRRADGYYVQVCLDVERVEKREPTGKTIGLDVGLTHFYTDSDGQTVENPCAIAPRFANAILGTGLTH